MNRAFFQKKRQRELMWQGTAEQQKEKDNELQVTATEVRGGLAPCEAPALGEQLQEPSSLR